MNVYERNYQRKKEIVLREIGGETLLIPINQTGADLQKIYVLNETALCVWQKIASPQTLESLVSSLKGEFEGSQIEIAKHVTELLGDLAELDLIEICQVK